MVWWIVKPRSRVIYKKQTPRSKLVNKLPNLPIIFLLKLVGVVLGVFIFFYAVFVIFQKTVFSEKYKINEVLFAQESVAQYDDPYFYQFLQELVIWKNYYITKYFKENSLKRKSNRIFPLVRDLKVIFGGSGIVTLDVSYNEPDFIVKHENKTFGMKSDFIFEIFSGSSIWSDSLTLELPQYIWSLDSLSWLFYVTKTDEMKYYLDLLNKEFPNNQRIVYLVGSEKILVFDSDKRIYFNLSRSLDEQLKNYNNLKKYYWKFPQLKEIDLWSLASGKVIVK